VLTDKDADDGSQVGPLLDRSDGAVASVTGDGAYDRDDVYAEVAARHDLPPEKWTPGYADFRSACSGVM
jgi:hypothetical protein